MMIRQRKFEIKKQYLIIDSFNFLLIAAGASLRSQEENAFENIVKAMTFKLKKLFPDHRIYACWDTAGGTSFRKDISGDKYKSNRLDHAKPVDIEELLKIKPFFTSIGIINVEIPETEADDVIYVLCRKLRLQEPKSEITIVSRDKDMLQVVQKGYANNQYDYTRKTNLEVPIYDIVTYKSLVGDPADCIPGVKGIGDKGAKKLMAESLLTGKLNLKPEQEEQYNKCRALVDATLHPRFQENIDYLDSLPYIK